MKTQLCGNRRRLVSGVMVGMLLGMGIPEAIAASPPAPQSSSPLSSVVEKLRQIISPSKDRGTASGRARGGAIRGNCAVMPADARQENDLVALIPTSNIGRTVVDYPTFWFYVPKFSLVPAGAAATTTPVPVTMGEFMLLDEQGQPMLKQPIAVKLPEQAGFSRLTLPNDQTFWMPGKTLEVGKRYNWFFSVVCDTKQPAKNPTVRGWVERAATPVDLQQRLQQVPAGDRYQVFVDNDDWFETLTLLAENRTTATESWTEVLTRLGLSETANEPISVLQPAQ